MAADEIRRLIVRGDLAAGERILEARLAEQLGISRPPLREALRILAARHVIEATPRRGYRVRALTPGDDREIADLRDLLEGFAVDRLEKGSGIIDLGSVRGAVSLMRDAASRGDEAAFLASYRAFHLAFIRLADHRRLAESYETLLDPLLLHSARRLLSAPDVSAAMAAAARAASALADSLAHDRSQIRQALEDFAGSVRVA